MTIRHFNICFLCAALFGATLATAQHPATTNAPRLVCDEPVFDFGTRDPSEPVEHTFLLRNEGTLTLEISRVHASCGCTVANISERSVPPGGESKITSRLSLQGRMGPQHKTITVDSNDPAQPQMILAMKGVAGYAVNAQPPQVMQPRVQPGSQPSADIIISGADETPFRITAVESTSDRLAATVTPMQENRAYRVTVALKDPLQAGTFSAQVVIQTDHPKRGRIEVPVSFVAQRELIVVPREISLPATSAEPLSRFVIVRYADNQSVVLTGVEPPLPGVTLDTQPFGQNGLRIVMNNLVPGADLNGRVLRIHPREGDPIEVPIRVAGAGN